MGESDLHRDIMVAVIEALKDFYREQSDVYISGNLFFYYEKGKPSSVFAPDAFVVFGVPKKQRRTYKLWLENNKPPDIVFEITSKSTWLEDEGTKMAVCRHLGVQEYILFDPLNEYLSPQLQGYRLEAGEYVRLPATSEGEIYSTVMNLKLRPDGFYLRLIDGRTNEPLLTPFEAQEAHRAEVRARQKAEAEVERLRAELEKLRNP